MVRDVCRCLVQLCRELKLARPRFAAPHGPKHVGYCLERRPEAAMPAIRCVDIIALMARALLYLRVRPTPVTALRCTICPKADSAGSDPAESNNSGDKVKLGLVS